MVLEAGQTDRNGRQAGRERGRAGVGGGEGVLASTALIGFPENSNQIIGLPPFTVTQTAARLTSYLGLCVARQDSVVLIV